MSGGVSASVSNATQSVATYGVQGIIPWSDIVYTPGSQVAAYSLPRQKIKYAYTYDANNDRMLRMVAYGPLMLSAKKPYSIKGETPWVKDGLYISQSYRYDAAGNMTDMSQSEWDGMTQSHHYSYDVIHQLSGYDNQVAGVKKSQSTRYTYDPQGNRLSLPPNGGPKF